MQLTTLLQKYDSIIKEEINVKELKTIGDELKIDKTFKPLGNKLSAKFGKDTAKIIMNGKQGNIKPDGQGMIVFDDQGNERKLDAGDYEIAYEGLEANNIAVDNNIIAQMDLELTPILIQEGVAREISRFLNQMRKDANYNVDDKVGLIYQTEDNYLEEIMQKFGEFFQDEALLKTITKSTKQPEGDILAEFVSEERILLFALQK